MSSIGDVAGLIVVVHDQNTVPFPEDEGITAHPGELLSIGVRRVSNDKKHTCVWSCLCVTYQAGCYNTLAYSVSFFFCRVRNVKSVIVHINTIGHVGCLIN